MEFKKKKQMKMSHIDDVAMHSTPLIWNYAPKQVIQFALGNTHTSLTSPNLKQKILWFVGDCAGKKAFSTVTSIVHNLHT